MKIGGVVLWCCPLVNILSVYCSRTSRDMWDNFIFVEVSVACFFNTVGVATDPIR